MSNQPPLKSTDVERQEAKESQTQKAAPLNYLLAYDGSEHSRAAVSLLLELPQKSGGLPGDCTVTLISVMPTQGIGDHEVLQANLNKEELRLRDAGYKTQSIMKAGNPAATINEYAEEIGASLIVIGAIGLRAALNILLGGVAQQVVEYSNCPVLVVRAPYSGLKRVLLVVDGSESSLKAVNYLAQPCQGGLRKRCAWLPPSAEIDLMHVLPPPISDEVALRAWALGPEALYPTPVIPIDKTALEASEERNGEHLLQDVSKNLENAGLEPRSLLVRGDAANEIIHRIQEQHIDLVVCGSRGLSAVSGWLLGSVSRKLVHYAGCSVLIVK
jgi:nucleotide-binding universal stress UspA family protein